MSISVEVCPTIPTRPCSFCLCLQGGSVFADFDTDSNNVVSLRRVSFDGFGCCEAGASVAKMSSNDSRVILDAIARGEPESIQVEDALRRYFRDNMGVIWTDALVQYELI